MAGATGELEFVARLTDEASSAADKLERNMRGLGGPVAPITAAVEVEARGIMDTEGDLDAALDRIVRDFDDAGEDAGSQMRREIGGELDRVDDDVRRVGSQAGGSFGSAFRGGLAAIGSLIAVDQIAEQTWSVVQAASDLSETVNKSNVIFGSNAAEIEAWASTASTSVGLSKSAAMEAAAGYGNMLSQLGYTADAAADTSVATVQLAADLGSFNNLDTADVNDRISAALRGEYDSLQALIPNINAARVEQEALAATGKSSASELTAAEKASATLAIIQRDGAAAAGDFAETVDGVANSQKVAAAQTEDLKANLGQQLQPVVQSLFGWLNSTAIPALSGFVDGMRNGTGAGGALAGAVRTVAGAFQTGVQWVREHSQLMSFLVTVIGTAVGVIGTIVAALRIWAAVQTVLNVVMTANPIGIIIVAIAALVAAIVWIATQTTWFQDLWGAVWGWITDTASAFMEWFRGAVAAVSEWWSQKWAEIKATAELVWSVIVAVVTTYINTVRAIITGVVSTIVSYWQNAWNGVKAVASSIWNGIRSVIETAINSVRNIISGVLNVIRGIFTGNFDQIKAGVGQALGGVIGLVRGLPAQALSALGNVGRTLFNSGKSLIDGFKDGIMNAFTSVKNAVSGGLSSVRNLFPFSPAKEGPFSGRGYTTWSGRALAQDFAAAIASQAGVVEAAASELMSAASLDATPVITASVSGSSAGVSTVTGPAVVTIRHVVDVENGELPDGMTAEEIAAVLAGNPVARSRIEAIVREETRAKSIRTLTAS